MSDPVYLRAHLYEQLKQDVKTTGGPLEVRIENLRKMIGDVWAMKQGEPEVQTLRDKVRELQATFNPYVDTLDELMEFRGGVAAKTSDLWDEVQTMINHYRLIKEFNMDSALPAQELKNIKTRILEGEE